MSASRTVTELFLKELQARGLPAPHAHDGDSLVLEIGAMTINVNLDNLIREYSAHGSTERLSARIVDFVDTIVKALADAEPVSWPEAEPGIRFAAEPTDYEFGDSLREQITDTLVRVVVRADGNQLIFVTPRMLTSWGVSREQVEEVARRNMAGLLAETGLQVETIDDSPLGMLPTDSASKAALIFSPNLRDVVEAQLGWPVLMMIPNRDFAYLIRDGDNELLGRIAPVVVNEFQRSSYPISTEVYRVSDDGIEAVGRFEIKIGPEPAAGMKRIDYRGGVVRFCIPEHWEEEYEEDGGGTFWDDDEESGTLRLNVITLKTEEPVNEETATHLLRVQAEARQMTAAIESLPRGSALLRYRLEPDGDEDEVTWFWEIVGLVPPDHARYCIFSFGIDSAQADDEAVLEQVESINRELRRCEFADEVGE